VGRIVGLTLLSLSGPQAFDSYRITDLPQEGCALFVVSTMGDGEEPDNMKASWRFLLRRSLPPGSLAGLRFGVMGLGDSSYPKFNAVARRLYVRIHCRCGVFMYI
jgi:sulfite reductase alpha subunit-like flavoprotein